MNRAIVPTIAALAFAGVAGGSASAMVVPGPAIGPGSVTYGSTCVVGGTCTPTPPTPAPVPAPTPVVQPPGVVINPYPSDPADPADGSRRTKQMKSPAGDANCTVSVTKTVYVTGLDKVTRNPVIGGIAEGVCGGDVRRAVLIIRVRRVMPIADFGQQALPRSGPGAIGPLGTGHVCDGPFTSPMRSYVVLANTMVTNREGQVWQSPFVSSNVSRLPC